MESVTRGVRPSKSSSFPPATFKENTQSRRRGNVSFSLPNWTIEWIILSKYRYISDLSFNEAPLFLMRLGFRPPKDYFSTVIWVVFVLIRHCRGQHWKSPGPRRLLIRGKRETTLTRGEGMGSPRRIWWASFVPNQCQYWDDGKKKSDFPKE
jgi:hypothetical protein